MPAEGQWKKFFYSRLFLLILILAAAGVITACGRAFYRDYQVKREIGRLQEEMERLTSRRLQTLDTITYLKSQEFAEEKARTELNLAAPGEKAVMIAGTGSPALSPALVVDQTDNKISNVAYWWQYFFGKNF